MRTRAKRGNRAVICPKCGTKTGADRTECPHCEAVLDDDQVILEVEPSEEPHDSWMERIQGRALDVGLVATAIAMLAAINIANSDPAPPTPPRIQPRTSPAPATAAAASSGPAIVASGSDVPGAASSEPGQSETDAEDALLAARQWLRAGAKEQALTHLRRVAVDNPDHPEVRHTLGRLLVDLDHPEEALRHLEMAAEAHPEEWRYHLDYAEALEAINGWDLAAEAYESVVKLRPGHTETLMKHGNALAQTGDHLGALQAYLKGLDESPNHAPLYRALGTTYEEMDRRIDARLAYERFLELAPGAADTEDIRARMAAMDAPALARTASEVELE